MFVYIKGPEPLGSASRPQKVQSLLKEILNAFPSIPDLLGSKCDCTHIRFRNSSFNAYAATEDRWF
jgi:hypothetical protein